MVAMSALKLCSGFPLTAAQLVDPQKNGHRLPSREMVLPLLNQLVKSSIAF
jgi:hypothetical protein